MWEVIKSVFGWLASRQDTKTAQVADQAVRDQKPNLLIQQMISQVNANNFWLIAIETQVALIVIWNIAAYGFGWPIFKTQFDSFQLLMGFLGMHVIKIGHTYSIK